MKASSRAAPTESTATPFDVVLGDAALCADALGAGALAAGAGSVGAGSGVCAMAAPVMQSIATDNPEARAQRAKGAELARLELETETLTLGRVVRLTEVAPM